MIIDITDKYAKIKYGNQTFTYPLNTLSYTVNEESQVVTFFRNNEPIGTSSFQSVKVNGQLVTQGNVHEILSALYNTKGVGAETASSIKEKYESNPDTNPFTDFYKSQVDTNKAHIADLNQDIGTLQGALIYLGNIGNSTEEIETDHSLLTAWIEANRPDILPLKKGYTLVDDNANDWWYDGADWVNIGYYEVSTATHTSLGVVKGSTADLKVSIDANGEMSVNNLVTNLNGKEPKFDKNTAFNKNFATDGSAITVARGDHTHSLGRKPATDLPSTYPMGISVSSAFNNGYPSTYGEIFTSRAFNPVTSAVSQFFIEWTAANQVAGMWIRSSRDSIDAWSNWSKIASENDVKTAIDNIQIGGVNLIKNSNFQIGFSNWYTYGTITNTIVSDTIFGQAAKVTTTNQGSGIYSTVFNQKVGDSFTLSAYAKADSPMTLFISNEGSDFPGGRKDIPITTEWQRIFVTSKILRAGNNGSNTLSFYSSSATPSGTFYITNVKYEINSNKVTNWSPALDDLEIGGNNLLLGASNGIGWRYTRFANNTFEVDNSSTTSEQYLQNDNSRISVYSGQQLTISFEHKETSNVRSTEFFLLGGTPNINIQYANSSVWKKESFTFVVPDGWGNIESPVTTAYIRFDNNGSTNGQTSTLYVRNIKLGNKATDWSPNYKDSQSVYSYNGNERFTGNFWLNGKKIYRKTILLTIPTTAGTRSDTAHNIANMDRVISHESIATISGTFRLLPFVHDQSKDFDVMILISKTAIQLGLGVTSPIPTDAYSTIYYICTDR